MLKLFNKDLSPLLATDDELKCLPPAYCVILEWDMLRDEGLLYAERLRLNGCNVEVDLYENAFHGIATSISDNYMGFDIAKTMFEKMVNKIKTSV